MITKPQLLEELARRSFYEDCEIERVGDGWMVTNTYAVEPDREPGDSDPVVIYDRSQRPTCNPEEEGC